MNNENLKQKKIERSKSEIRESKLIHEYQYQKIKEHHASYVQKDLEDIEFSYNINLISDTLKSWFDNLKPNDKRRTLLNGMRLACINIMVYQFAWRKTLNRATVEYLSEKKRHLNALQEINNKNKEIKSLQKQVESLKKEVAYYEKESEEKSDTN